MMTKRRYTLLISFLSLILLSDTSVADQLKPGDHLVKIELLDQFDQPHILDEQINVLFYSNSKQAGSTMSTILADVPQDHLTERNAVYIADISGMPWLVTRLFALPKMREIETPIYLSRESVQTEWLPSEEDKVTVVKLLSGAVEQINFTADEETLRSILEIPSPETQDSP